MVEAGGERADRDGAARSGGSALPEKPETIPLTPLRAAYERVRQLPLDEQLRDVADHLGHPEVLARDLRDSRAMIKGWRATLGSDEVEAGVASLELDGDPDSLFYPSREIAVVGAPCSFTCLATGLDPLQGPDDRNSLDYAAVTCDDSRTPVLGAVQSERDTSAYPLLLRGLATLVEMADSDQLSRLDRTVFRGFLGAPPGFDLDLVVWEECGPSERTAIEQLTRDLAERALCLLRGDPDCKDLVRGVVCLRMNPDRFDFRLRFGWRV